MLAPRHIEQSHTPAADTMRGEPNSMLWQLASKPSGVTVEFTGNVLPLKLGLGHGEEIFATSSLPEYCTLNDEVPRRLTPHLNCTRAPPAAGGASGALANIITPPRQAASCRSASRHGNKVCSIPSIVMLSVERSPVKSRAVPNTISASFQRMRESLSEMVSRRRASAGTENVPVISTLAS